MNKVINITAGRCFPILISAGGTPYKFCQFLFPQVKAEVVLLKRGKKG